MWNYIPTILIYSNNTSLDPLREILKLNNEFIVLDETSYDINSKYDTIIFDMSIDTRQQSIELGHAIKSFGENNIICLYQSYQTIPTTQFNITTIQYDINNSDNLLKELNLDDINEISFVNSEKNPIKELLINLLNKKELFRSNNDTYSNINYIINSNKKFEDGFNIVILNHSNFKYEKIYIDMCSYGYNGDYKHIAEIDNIEINQEKIINLQYTHENIPMTQRELPRDNCWFEIENVYEMNLEIRISYYISIWKKMTTTEYLLYPQNQFNDDANEKIEINEDDLFMPTIIDDVNNHSYHGLKPPNIKIILMDDFIKVFSYIIKN